MCPVWYCQCLTVSYLSLCHQIQWQCCQIYRVGKNWPTGNSHTGKSRYFPGWEIICFQSMWEITIFKIYINTRNYPNIAAKCTTLHSVMHYGAMIISSGQGNIYRFTLTSVIVHEWQKTNLCQLTCVRTEPGHLGSCFSWQRQLSW